ncbi:phosphoribosyl-ATP pyrophosphatase [Fadolivirus algeromassiliense]|uniref:Phosphoribosyl-ATP pyrophosphatase n=1 Tax=Fadolivirus FV1/VV64 TaxID=3070911 RepID=A0A7D3V5H9_9VIRU|nr:phosphoribosyl-ATP pyrophosphatase [Fadolivirus algeromassiliense]QKF93872.1 phosphoribosyl-ATP pyrophosphatase [Fadolivirus FV1/VV64]
MQAIFILCGNDGTGKSTVSQLLNQTDEYIAIERSNELAGKYNINPSIVDNLTLGPPFDQRDDLVLQESVLVDGKQVPVYWAILDASIETIKKRISNRKYHDKWESDKALFYYRQRFRELAAFYGIPLIDTTNLSINEVVLQVTDLHKQDRYYKEVRQLALKDLTYEKINEMDIENKVRDILKGYDCSFDTTLIDDLPTNEFYKEVLKQMPQDYKEKLFVKWWVNGDMKVNNNEIQFNKKGMLITVPYTTPLLKLYTEGESKKMYKFITNNPYFKNTAVIILKSTIYSHSMQATGEIKDLGKIRAVGTQIFLEMMYRNGLKHTYMSINNNGIIFSNYLPEVPPTEIVVKKYCEGTDKHSYYQILNSPEIVLPTGEYKSGPYVRFDWRNPNHLDKISGLSVAQNRYYYLFEESLGKENFFKMFLTNNDYIKPFGDKSISEELLLKTINTTETKKSVLKMFNTIQYYFKQVGLEIKDICFMLDHTGSVFWSEINQDCMRIKTSDKSDQFDKDIWRAGGSASKDLITKKWINFNEVMMKYFSQNIFHKSELNNISSYGYESEVKLTVNDSRLTIPPSLMELYRSMLIKNRRRVIVTMDMYDGKPVLVRSGKVYTTHSDGDYKKAMETISIFPDILVVDLNGALSEGQSNRKIVKELAQKYYVHSGGGLRTIEDVQDVLKSSARRIVLSSANDDLIKQVPKDRLIVELSVNENNEVLIHGRKTNTGISIFKRLNEMSNYGVEAISITFHNTEGHMKGIPRAQLSEIMLNMPTSIQKVIIAGGISSIDDLEYLWSYEKIIPQLGSAIWTNQISIGDLYNSMIYFDGEGKVPAIIQDTHGRVKGEVYMNNESINLTCENRQLYRYSRKTKSIMKKGDTSGDYQKVYKMSLDCDSDALLITVDTEKPFCHTKNYSCFSLQTVVKANIGTLTEHIKSRMTTNSYSGMMQQHPELPLAKLMEEFWEIVTAYGDTQVSECSDLLVHLLMYLNGMGISIEDILNELNARRWDPHLTQKQKKVKDMTKVLIGITAAKYSDKTDEYALNELGLKIIRHDGRSLKLDCEIVDKDKYSKYFGNKVPSLVTSRPKDMPWLLASGRIDYVITYETVVKNFPKVYKAVNEIIDPTISLALICRKGMSIDVANWNEDNKVLIAAEHVWHVSEYFHKHAIPQNSYHMDRVIGSSEGFLINTDKYLLCDAVVESGRTLVENNLEVWQTIIPKGMIKMGLYSNLFI